MIYIDSLRIQLIIGMPKGAILSLVLNEPIQVDLHFNSQGPTPTKSCINFKNTLVGPANFHAYKF